MDPVEARLLTGLLAPRTPARNARPCTQKIARILEQRDRRNETRPGTTCRSPCSRKRGCASGGQFKNSRVARTLATPAGRALAAYLGSIDLRKTQNHCPTAAYHAQAPSGVRAVVLCGCVQISERFPPLHPLLLVHALRQRILTRSDDSRSPVGDRNTDLAITTSNAHHAGCQTP